MKQKVKVRDTAATTINCWIWRGNSINAKAAMTLTLRSFLVTADY